MRSGFFPMVLAASLIWGCASKEIKSEKRKMKAGGSVCEPKSQEAAHAAIFTRARASAFAGCFANYLKLNNLEALSVNVCARVSARKDGSVYRARVTGMDKDLSNDLRWCLEQELWKMDFSKLQFTSSQNLNFPLRFEVRK